MKKSIIIITALAMALLLMACGKSGPTDTVERFAPAAPVDSGSLAIPGYEGLVFTADSAVQEVYLTNPPQNACSFVMTLTLDDGETLWEGRAIGPGEAFTSIVLTRPLAAGEYGATLRYQCYSLEDETPLNGAEIQLTIAAR